jgi:hypothetical protein
VAATASNSQVDQGQLNKGSAGATPVALALARGIWSEALHVASVSVPLALGVAKTLCLMPVLQVLLCCSRGLSRGKDPCEPLQDATGFAHEALRTSTVTRTSYDPGHH